MPSGVVARGCARFFQAGPVVALLLRPTTRPASLAKTAVRSEPSKKDTTSPQRHSRFPAVSPRTPRLDLIEEHIRASAVGRDDDGPLRGARQKRHLGTDRRISPFWGRAFQWMDNPCFAPCRDAGRRHVVLSHCVYVCPVTVFSRLLSSAKYEGQSARAGLTRHVWARRARAERPRHFASAPSPPFCSRCIPGT